jgi:hypothetical protein
MYNFQMNTHARGHNLVVAFFASIFVLPPNGIRRHEKSAAECGMLLEGACASLSWTLAWARERVSSQLE